MNYLILVCVYIGKLTEILISTIYFIIRGKINIKHTIYQASMIGVNSLPIILLITAFTGMVIALQTVHELNKFGGGQFAGGMIAVAMARELAPVLVGVVIAGRAGSAIAAEIGTMKVTEQIDALIVMATNPIYYLIVPRLLAAIIMLPLLTILANFAGTGGGYFIACYFGNVSPFDFYYSATTFLRLIEFIYGLIKSAIFGLIVVIVSCQQGMDTEGGAAGVGRSTTNSVVLSIIFIFIANYFLSFLMFGGGISP